MPSPAAHRNRRDRLMAEVPGPIFLVGNGERDRNLPGSGLPFRQDSTFWYLTGCTLPSAALLLDDGKSTLFLPPTPPDDDLWHGHTDPPEALRERFGVDAVQPLDEATEAALAARKPRTLAVPDPAATAVAARVSGAELVFGCQFGDPDLADAVIRMRRTKDADELAELRACAAITVEAHRLAMAATRPGLTEAGLTALFEAFLASHGATTGYDTILTQRGEILHNHAHDGVLTDGELLLLDGGAELRRSGYTADVTRTWPVNGKYNPQQRAAYTAVLEAQQAAIRVATAGTRYRRVHDAASRVLAQFLLDEGIFRGTSADAIVERGAHALFFPHGVGHLLGLDVHDLKAFGDRGAYPPGAQRSTQFGTSYLRLDLPLEPGWVVTIEPGFYVVPSILRRADLRASFSDILDLDAVARWHGFGGIRIEDDVVITDGAPEVLTEAAPKSIPDVEAAIGRGVSLQEVIR
jgi:Xaa-Pro aminopeptidase